MGEDAPPANMIAMEALIAEAAPLPPAPQPNEAVTGIYYTGGTTGHPKGVMHSALSLWAGATCIAMEMQGPRPPPRSEERRGGTESVRTCRTGWWRDHTKNKKKRRETS